MRLTAILVTLGASLVRCAVDIDGNQVTEPLENGDPSPISDPKTYHPDQHDCPLVCSDYANVHSWIPYNTVERLERCKEPMLLQFSVLHPLDDPKTTVLIRGCTLGETPISESRLNIQSIENPKKDEALFASSLTTAPACFANGTETTRSVSIAAAGASQSNSTEVGKILDGMRKYWDSQENCDESFIFAYYKKTVGSMYIGDGYGKGTASSMLKEVEPVATSSNRTVAQICGDASLTGALGLFVDGSGDLVAAQKAAAQWSQGKCFIDEDNDAVASSHKVKTWEIPAANGTAINATSSVNSTLPRMIRGLSVDHRKRNHNHNHKRAECRYITVVSGDGCASLVSRCGISSADFYKFNPKSDLCSTLHVGDYVCCSSGDQHTDPKPDAPKPNADGTCATHLIALGDTCSSLAKQYGITEANIETWNKGRVWAWTECGKMLSGYNMCLSEGAVPLPPPQQGTECGPIVPGTQRPSNTSISIADLNPCPLKACCSNWGFCGPFPEHCNINAPEGGGPGVKLPLAKSTCISNCGNEIKQNSGPPATFSRIGYYESWNLGRECLWLKARDANTDGTYTHIHWGFLEIDPSTFKPVIVDKFQQWTDFKNLQNVKRIISFGGWAYSTQASTFNIIRDAILTNGDTFANNIVQFLNDEGLDGVDIDWEYPGAPDILVDGQPIGQKTDGIGYYRFLAALKQKAGSKSVSIAAPASYWYLKAFPIDRIANVIDYIVYMTYDLHGQWDYGNPNAYDACPSGRCIRSHVNLTETRNALSIVTKAGVPNNKIFVGESSYGRSFHMASDGCWGPMCEFTGSRTKSDAQPGRCTGEGGYIGLAEINEIIQEAEAVERFHDDESNSDILLYKGDYISYMTPITKDTRREDWKKFNFAGSIDWAVDLQSFGSTDFNAPPNNGAAGSQGCVSGEDSTVNSGDICEFSCKFDFCPESLCECTRRGTISALPSEVPGMDEIIAWDRQNVDLNRLCKFTCKHGYCPSDVCELPVVDEELEGGLMYDPTDPAQMDYDAIRQGNLKNCRVYQDTSIQKDAQFQCEPTCRQAVKDAQAAGRTTNYGCVGHFPGSKPSDPIPWENRPDLHEVSAPGKCSCDNWLVNELADNIIDALPVIAQIGCYMLMSSLKLVLDIGVTFLTGGVGKALEAGLDMAASAAQMASYFYPEEQDPEGAFSWWLSPCGGTELVPDEIKKLFGILSQVADGVTSFVKPKGDKGKHTGKKGDDGNPINPRGPKAGTGKGPNGLQTTKQKGCKVAPAKQKYRPAPHVIREQRCVGGKSGTTTVTETFVSTITYQANATPMKVTKTCDAQHTQACYHYSSAIRNNPSWETLICPKEAAATKKPKLGRKAVATYDAQHAKRWTEWDPTLASGRTHDDCERDEYPPVYLLNAASPAYTNIGQPGGQLIRFLPDGENGGAASKWRSVCFNPLFQDMSDAEYARKFIKGPPPPPTGKPPPAPKPNQIIKNVEQHHGHMFSDKRPEFSFTGWGHSNRAPLKDDGLWDNPCWPKNWAVNDPGFALYTHDPWYTSNGRQPFANYAV